MKKFIPLLTIFLTAPALANPYTYTAQCALETPTEFQLDTCKVIETRESNGALRTRNIFSNRFGLTVKSWFDKNNGFMTWDSHNKFNYKWSYTVTQVGDLGGWSTVMPGFSVQNVSWD